MAFIPSHSTVSWRLVSFSSGLVNCARVPSSGEDQRVESGAEGFGAREAIQGGARSTYQWLFRVPLQLLVTHCGRTVGLALSLTRSFSHALARSRSL
eukprot:6212932-Pleurochrysis_carterae.AAC.1